MSRRVKYATLRKYQPYIDAIRKDLGIPKKACIVVSFTNWNAHKQGNGIYCRESKYGEVNVSKRLSHDDTLRVLMHEFRHVWQYHTGKLRTGLFQSKQWGKRIISIPIAIWEGKSYRDYSGDTARHYDKYLETPWEVDASKYEESIFRLFPDGRVLEFTPRILIGEINNIKFYRERP